MRKFVIVKNENLNNQKFHVVLVGENGENLSSTENLSSKAASLINITAQRKGDSPLPIEYKTISKEK